MTRALWTFAVLLSHWRRHPMQFATLAIGLIAATALWSGVQALNQQARTSYDRAAAIFGGTRTPMLLGRDGPLIPQSLYVSLRRAGWPVSPVLEGRVEINGRTLRVVGIEPLSMPRQSGEGGLGPANLQQFLGPPGETLISSETMKEFGWRDGDTPSYAGGGSLPPLRAQADLLPGGVVVDIGVAQRVMKQPDQISRLLVGPNAPPPNRLEAIAGNQLRYVAAEDDSDLGRLTDSFHLNLTAFGLLSFAVGLFIVNSAIGLAFEQRLPMLRTLRAGGVSARMLNAVLVAEMLALSLVAGLIGLFGGYIIAALLLPDVAASLRGLYGAQIPGELSLAPRWWFLGIAISVIGALAASASSLLKAARLPLLATALPVAWRDAQRRWLIGQSALALAIAAGGLACFLFGDSLLAAFAVLGALLLGAALVLPAAIAMLLRLSERAASGPLSQWFFADGRQQLSGLSLALMALLLALAVNVGVSTMVGSFDRTFRTWIEGRLAADVYLNATSDEQGREIVAWLRQRNDVTAILPGGREEIELQNAPVEILGFADHSTFTDHWPLLASRADAWDRLRGGDAAFISEQMARRMKLSLGDRVVIPTASGSWPVEIVAIYADYGNPKGQLSVNIDALRAHYPDTPRTRFGLRVTPGAAAAVVAAIRTRFPLDERSLADQVTIKAESLRIFNRTFAVTAALNAFTLGVAGVALLTSLLTLSQSRLPQLAPLWALGLTRRRIALLELGKTLSVALITALAAVPLGIVVAWCLIAVVNVKAFGWRLPLHVFPLQLLELLGVAMLAALAAAALPMLRLARMQPADLVRVFANER